MDKKISHEYFKYTGEKEVAETHSKLLRNFAELLEILGTVAVGEDLEGYMLSVFLVVEFTISGQIPSSIRNAIKEVLVSLRMFYNLYNIYQKV